MNFVTMIQAKKSLAGSFVHAGESVTRALAATSGYCSVMPYFAGICWNCLHIYLQWSHPTVTHNPLVGNLLWRSNPG